LEIVTIFCTSPFIVIFQIVEKLRKTIEKKDDDHTCLGDANERRWWWAI